MCLNSLAKQYQGLADYNSATRRQGDWLYFRNIAWMSHVAKETFDTLRNTLCIEIIGSTTWRLTLHGSIALSYATQRSYNEQCVSHMIKGFLIGLFNTSNQHLRRHKAPYAENVSWLCHLQGPLERLERETHDVIDGCPSIPHGRDYNDVVFDIVNRIDGFTALADAIRANNPIQTIGLKVEQYKDDAFDFYAMTGLIISTGANTQQYD